MAAVNSSPFLIEIDSINWLNFSFTGYSTIIFLIFGLSLHPIAMSSSKEVKYTSRSITPPSRQRGSGSPSKLGGRSRSRSQDYSEARNPGNNLYVTGLSPRVTNEDLEKYFSKEGKVQECQVVVDPKTKESRGFAFVTMETAEDADRCIKLFDRSVLEGRLMVVEKAKRRRGRTPTPGTYRGARERRDGTRKRSQSRSPSSNYPHHHREHSHSRERGRQQRSRSPCGREFHRRRERSRSV